MILVAVSGYRRLNDPDFVRDMLVKHINPYDSVVIVGDATGVDAFVKEWCHKEGIPVGIFPANWHKYGKSAGPIRNEVLVDLADVVIAFPGADSKGTRNTINLAKQAGKPVHIFELSD